MEILNEIWSFIDSIGWLIVILVLAVGCWILYKIGKYREFNSPDDILYKNEYRKRNPMECPYDIEGRSCKHYNGATGYLDIDCKDCNWYNNGVRPSKL